MSVADLILANFRGREDVVAVCDDGKTFHPSELKEPLRPEWLDKEHLSGKRCLGFYLTMDGNAVLCSCVDFDNKPETPDPAWMSKTEQVYYLLSNIGLSPLVEVSQSGNAAHVWMFFSEDCAAWLVRAFWRSVSAKLDVHFPEIYPRQDRLSGKGIGNLVRYPLWGQSRFVDVENEWQPLDAEKALTEVKRTTELDLKLLAFEMGGGELRPESPLPNETSERSGVSTRVQQRLAKSYSLLARRWAGDMEGLGDPSRSALVQSIACELVRTYVPTVEVEHALRHWCAENGYEKGERDDWIARTVQKAYDFSGSRTEARSEVTTLKDACIEYLDMLSRGGMRTVPSGIAELDRSMEGVGFGEMCVVAAQSSHGKTAFALQWLHSASLRNLPCLIISEEMGKLMLGKRGLEYLSEVDEDQWTQHADVVREEIKEHFDVRAPYYVIESCGSIERAVERIDEYCSISGVRVVAVDYMQLLGSKQQSRYEAVTEISKQLKQAAVRNNCVLLALSQMNRSVDKREDRNPKLSDLRESGQIEQDADVVLFLQWLFRFDPKADREKYLIWVAKRRNGPIKDPVVVTVFDGARQTIGNAKLVAGATDWNP